MEKIPFSNYLIWSKTNLYTYSKQILHNLLYSKNLINLEKFKLEMSKSHKNEEAKDHNDKNKQKIPQSVITHYSKYRSTKTNIKSFLVMGTRFEVEDKYEIIDSGKTLFRTKL